MSSKPEHWIALDNSPGLEDLIIYQVMRGFVT